MFKISSSVGNRGINAHIDVQTVQSLLNKNIRLLTPLLPLKTDGKCGPVTIGVIVGFQRRVMKTVRPDGKVDPGRATIKKLNDLLDEDKSSDQPNTNFDQLLFKVQLWLKSFLPKDPNDALEQQHKTLREADYRKAASVLDVDIATIKAVASIESSGSGFLANGKPKILFEGHWFSRLTGNKYDSTHATISYKSWVKDYYKGGAAEYSRFDVAASLNSTAAMESASWGKFQIMGFNYKQCGYASVEAFVKEMYLSEGYHLLAFVRLIKAKKWDAKLKAKDWAGFAKVYNGPRYAENKYDVRLAQAYKAFSAGGSR